MAFVLDDMVFWPSINDLSEGTALDLVAVLASGELIVVGLVFAGNKSSGKLKCRALGQTNITGKSTNFTSDFLHALFALHNCSVDFNNTCNNIGLGIMLKCRALGQTNIT